MEFTTYPFCAACSSNRGSPSGVSPAPPTTKRYSGNQFPFQLVRCRHQTRDHRGGRRPDRDHRRRDHREHHCRSRQIPVRTLSVTLVEELRQTEHGCQHKQVGSTPRYATQDSITLHAPSRSAPSHRKRNGVATSPTTEVMRVSTCDDANVRAKSRDRDGGTDSDIQDTDATLGLSGVADQLFVPVPNLQLRPELLHPARQRNVMQHDQTARRG